MEETNYDRPARPHSQDEGLMSEAQAADSTAGSESEIKAASGNEKQETSSAAPTDGETGQVEYPRKTYIQKLGIKDKPRPNRILDSALGALRGFTYPSVVYAGYIISTQYCHTDHRADSIPG